MVIIHGICEHGGRYARLAEALCQAGYAVFVPDLRGHGRSQGDRLAIRRFDDYLDDLELFLDVARQQVSGPLYLLGHSMGGAIVARLATIRAPRIDGLVLSAPAIRVAGNLFPLLRRLAWLASRLIPRISLLRLGESRLSRDPAVVADFRSDPLVYHGKFPVRTGAEILDAGQQLQAAADRLQLPLLILHGTGDFVTDPGGSKLFHSRASSTDKTLLLYPRLYHDLFHEPEHPKITADLLAWLAERVGIRD